jgi:ElaB/YqjD/DUF883 family membrane-anchored ribosome-binding protein
MSSDLPPLRYMGTQSRETVNMAAALAATMAKDTAHAPERAAASSGFGAEDSKVREAASWAVSKAAATLHSATEHVRTRATAAVAAYTRKDPIRAILIAASAGALMMAVLAMTARSGARSITRRVQR